MSGDTMCADRTDVTVALVNNMPDSAFLDTEAQFRRATQLTAGPRVRLELYTITDIPRSPQIAAVIGTRYRGLSELWTRAPDALIVTGTEPTQAQMTDEPHWPALAQLLEWAGDAVPTVLLSCLAAHAGILLFDGIERTPRAHKCSGVLRGRVSDPDDPLARGLPREVPMPHSRVNEVAAEALTEAGYRIIVGAEGSAGWAVAAREWGDALFVLCQGHPEYGTLSLLREYRRDVRRFLLGGGAYAYPRLPEGYLPNRTVRTLEHFAARALGAGGDPRDLWGEFPYREVAADVKNTWAAASAILYTNWIQSAHAVAGAIA